MAWKHAKESRHARGYGSAWYRLRLSILARDCGLCQPCQRNGVLTQAQQVDHIMPKSKGGTDDESNLQAICVACHDTKTAKDMGQAERTRFDSSGRVVW
jgi:5-methylcytosine-specific restriction enzyme A